MNEPRGLSEDRSIKLGQGGKESGAFRITAEKAVIFLNVGFRSRTSKMGLLKSVNDPYNLSHAITLRLGNRVQSITINKIGY